MNPANANLGDVKKVDGGECETDPEMPELVPLLPGEVPLPRLIIFLVRWCSCCCHAYNSSS